ncbi:RDD family protein [Halomicrococcus sp. NG-SE-24]|uniref:RDD family protein n=1 Tax=Halomicrococcus sp. NG-SE-24 TaxID=3436928 RepID=UPI003D9570A9
MANEGSKVLHLAKWSTRFGAWLIDVLLVSAVLGVVGDLVGPLPEFGSAFLFTGTDGLALWVYWTAFEGHGGQSPGKMVLDLRVTDREGGSIDYPTAAIESFGKAFLLPLDCLVGWLAMKGEKLRLFNRIASTIVIEVPDETPQGVTYDVPEE